MELMRKEQKEETVGERLDRLRIALGFPTETAFAEFLGFSSSSRINNVTSGGLPLSRMAEEQIIKKVHGLGPAWLRYADPSGMSVELARKLGLIPDSGRKGTTSQSPRNAR